MMRMKKRKTYEGFSLVEMLITTVILGFLMLTSALVLSTLIRVSTTSTNKARVRTESEYVLEMLRRTLRTTDPSNVRLYQSNTRRFNFENGNITEYSSFDEVTYPNQTGNEIHFKPNGSTGWICLAFYKGVSTDVDNSGNVNGYILRASKPDLADTRRSQSLLSWLINVVWKGDLLHTLYDLNRQFVERVGTGRKLNEF